MIFDQYYDLSFSDMDYNVFIEGFIDNVIALPQALLRLLEPYVLTELLKMCPCKRFRRKRKV